MQLVECPICDSKFDIEKLPEGTKLKCGKCKKIFGVVKDGEMVPVGVTTTPLAPVPAVEQPEAVSERARVAVEEEVIPRRRPVPARPRIEEPPEPKPKPEPLLYIGALVAFGAIATFFYVLSVVQAPPPYRDKDSEKIIELIQDKGAGSEKPEAAVSSEEEEKETE